MAKVQALIEISILLGSFLFGILFFYFASTYSKEEKKKKIDLVSSQFINYVIFIWLGKIIFHFKLFIQDPFAVLAYPSGSEAFYIATIIFVGSIGFQRYRGKISISDLLEVFVPVLIASSFMYEFIQMQFFQKNALPYLVLLIVLLIAYLLFEKTVAKQAILMLAWTMGLFILSFIAPFVMIFQFMITRVFILISILAMIAIYVYYRRRNEL